MMRTSLMVLLLLLVANVCPVAADIYKYRDADGVIRYTYDLAEVPEDQRPQVQTIEEAVREEVPAATAENPTADSKDEAASSANKKDEEEEEKVVDQATIEEMNQRKKELDQEFAGLMEEKYKLLKEKEKLETLAGRDTKAVAEYDAKVEKLNRKIADYQKRREVFEEEAQEIKEAVENQES